MIERRCLNCASALDASMRFCPRCGQRTDTARLSLADLWRDLMHSYVNIERSPLAFAWALLTRPGEVAREFVEGKRRRYYGPFATLTVLVGLTALAVNMTGYRMLAQDRFEAATIDALQHHFNLLLLAQLPLQALACMLLFRGARLTFTEHMVLAAYTLCMRAVVLGAVAALSPWLHLAAPTQQAVFGFWGLWYVYFGWAATQFYPGLSARNWGRGIAAAALTHGAIVLTVEAVAPVLRFVAAH